MADFYSILPGAELAEGGAAQVGNKAWNLMLMVKVGLPVPPAFVLPTEWRQRQQPGREADLQRALTDGIAELETATGLEFGAMRRPLLVSVRSGAAVSMPGMMETVLDVGLNMQTVEGLIHLTGNPRLAWDSYRRLVQGYSEVVSNLPTAPFDTLVATALASAGADNERELDFRSLRDLTHAMLACFAQQSGNTFLSDPFDQLSAAVAAVFASWDAPKAASYRKLNKLSDEAGTAVTLQNMVFGNAGSLSGAGVGFTRNPATGAREFYFDFQFNGQGEDVVAGRHKLRDNDRLQLVLPEIWTQLNAICRQLESLFGDAQDFEFTVQSGKLYLLQTRAAKRTDWAALVIAVALVAEGVIKPEQALVNLAAIDLGKVVRTSFAAPVPDVLVQAQVAGMGVASGAIAFDADAVKRLGTGGALVIMVRQDIVTSDYEGMALATGILAASGGRTSHAAVIARQLGKVCLVACPELKINMDLRQCSIGGKNFAEGDFTSLDGNTGAVHAGQLTPVTERPDAALAIIATWRALKPIQGKLSQG